MGKEPKPQTLLWQHLSSLSKHKKLSGKHKAALLDPAEQGGQSIQAKPGDTGAEKCSEWLQSTAECCVQGTQAAPGPGTRQKGTPRDGTHNRFAQPALPCQTTGTFMGTQKATGDVSLEEKRVPAEPSSLEPSQRPLLSLSQHCFPASAPAAAASCGKEEFCTLQLWKFAEICHLLLSWRLHPQLCHKLRVQPKPINIHTFI